MRIKTLKYNACNLFNFIYKFFKRQRFKSSIIYILKLEIIFFLRMFITKILYSDYIK